MCNQLHPGLPMRIRLAELSDASAIADIYAPYVLKTAISFEFQPPAAEEMRDRIAKISPVYPWLVAEDAGRVVGYVYADRHSARAAYQWSADVAVYLHGDYHRQGLGRRLYELLFRLLRQQGYHSLYAGIALPNEASIALHRAMGMAEVGVYREVGLKFGVWCDALWMGLNFDADRIPSEPPIGFDVLKQTSDIRSLIGDGARDGTA